MTVEEIKRAYSMRDVAGQYGLHPNRAGFIQCPFHTGDRTPSLKLYTDNFHCHACGADGDVFTFVMRMDNCDFKTAFLTLGGTYENAKAIERQYEAARKQASRKEARASKAHDDMAALRQAKRNQYHAAKAREKREREKVREHEREMAFADEVYKNNMIIKASKSLLDEAERFSDDWWYYFDIYHMALIQEKNILMEEGR
jgi:DNA primase